MVNNKSQKVIEELQVLEAIYGKQWKSEGRDNAYSIAVNRDVTLLITLNPNYPSKSPPQYMLLATVFTKADKERVREEFDEIYRYSYGGPIIYQWVEKLKEIMESSNEPSKRKPEGTIIESKTFDSHVVHGETIIDKGSVFQGHVSDISNVEQVRMFRSNLLQKKKIAQAKHNVSAYRIKLSNGTILQDYDDDGEKKAGEKLLHLLQKLNVVNKMVIVTRWYGGVHIGGRRFQHYHNAAHDVLNKWVA